MATQYRIYPTPRQAAWDVYGPTAKALGFKWTFLPDDTIDVTWPDGHAATLTEDEFFRWVREEVDGKIDQRLGLE